MSSSKAFHHYLGVTHPTTHPTNENLIDDLAPWRRCVHGRPKATTSSLLTMSEAANPWKRLTFDPSAM
jgi:hypothetical protein